MIIETLGILKAPRRQCKNKKKSAAQLFELSLLD
jgi:hypothetical protein